MYEIIKKFTEETEAFLRENVVVPRVNLGETRRAWFTLRKADAVNCLSPTGSSVPAWYLELGEAGGPLSFEGFWVPYTDERHYADEFSSADTKFVFTPTLDGCTFCHELIAGGRIKVGHYNYTSDGGGGRRVIDQARINALVAAYFPRGPEFHQLAKADYKLPTDLRGGEGIMMTVVGVRQDTEDPLGAMPLVTPGEHPWTFLCQKRQIRADATSWNDFTMLGTWQF
jgi:hypothetical protein